jgi:hypothetical protein
MDVFKARYYFMVQEMPTVKQYLGLVVAQLCRCMCVLCMAHALAILEDVIWLSWVQCVGLTLHETRCNVTTLIFLCWLRRRLSE